MIAKLLKQGMHYASGTLLLSIASLVSFPLLTRYLPIDQYGMLSLLTTLSGLFVAMYKFGLQQSIIRYFSRDNVFSSSILYSFVLSIFLVTIFLSSVYVFIDTNYKFLSILILISIFQSFRSIILSGYAAREETVYVNLVNVLYKYGSLGLMILFIFYYEMSAISVLLSILLADILIFTFLTFSWLRTFTIVKPKIETIRLLMIYGSPLMLAEIVQMSHAFVDRFLIEYYFDIEHVAIYVAPYSMSKIVADIIFGGLAVAIVPIYMGLWNKGEYRLTSELLTKVSDYYLLIFPISVGGLYLIAPALMEILASEKYAGTAYIMPIAFLGVGMFSSTFIYSAGIRLKNSQAPILQYVTESLLLNVGLNIMFLSEFGIQASAWATVASYFWMSLRFYLASKPTISIKFNWANLLSGVSIGLVLLGLKVVLPVNENVFLEIFYKLSIGAVVSMFLLLLLSSSIRGDTKKVCALILNKFYCRTK